MYISTVDILFYLEKKTRADVYLVNRLFFLCWRATFSLVGSLGEGGWNQCLYRSCFTRTIQHCCTITAHAASESEGVRLIRYFVLLADQVNCK